MLELPRAHAAIGGWLGGEARGSVQRGITFLSQAAWQDVCRELNVDLPWHTRRANVLVEGLDLAGTIGQVLRIGGISVRIMGETRPCALMDRLQPGLRSALAPAVRGGVHGEILTSGEIAVGDPVEVLPASAP
jgi:MOSC domain-containing protein YiiM